MKLIPDQWTVEDTEQLAQAIALVVVSFGLILLFSWWFAC